MRVSAVSKVRYSWHWLSLLNSRGKSEVFLSFIYKGNQDLGSFNDAYSGRGTKNSIMFMPGAYNRCPKAGHESRFLLLISQPDVRPYPRISDTSYFWIFYCSTLLPPASPKAHFSVIKPDTRFPAKQTRAVEVEDERWSALTMYLRVCFDLEGWNFKMLIAQGRTRERGKGKKVPLNLVGLAAVGETGRIREA